jgi:hypothetical protein
MDQRRTENFPKLVSRKPVGIPNEDSRSAKFPEDAKYEDVYW